MGGGPARAVRAVEPMPEWLSRRLTEAGYIDPMTGATRKARITFCHRCRAPVMRGIDQPFGGQSRDVTPSPVAPLAEALALLAGRRTFTIRYAGQFEIDIRDQFSIRGSPAGTREGWDVVIEHDCAIDGGGPQHWTPLTVGPPADAELPDEAPF